MTAPTQRDKAEAFRKLHSGSPLLVLPNAWDAGSARIFEVAGFPAIGTSSAGIAFSRGYPDGEKIAREEMLEVVARIVGRVDVPVTADMESGYGRTPDEVAQTINGVIDAGAVGVNLEDSTTEASAHLRPLDEQVERLRAAREAADRAGIPLVINARTDVYLLAAGQPESRLAQVLERARAYQSAGADCIFVPGLSDGATIARLVREIGGPVNVLAYPSTPPVADLARLGVARLSVGSGPARAALGLAREIARELRGHGTYGRFSEAAISYAELNKLLANRH